MPYTISKILVIIILVSSIGGAAASQAQVSIDPVSQTVEKGQEFSINITIDPVNNPVAGAQFNLIFDSNLLGIKNVIQGDFFRKNGITTFFISGIPDNSKGMLSNVWEVITTPGMNATSRDTFVRVNMYAKNAGSINLVFMNVKLSDPSGKSIPFILKNGTITISSIFPAVNLIQNPGFESGTSPWRFYTSGIGTFTRVSPGYEGNNSAKLSFSKIGSNTQLYQTGVTLESNTRYRLSFAAYSTKGHDFTVRLFKHVWPYTIYMPYYKADLGTGWQNFTAEFTTPRFPGTVNDGRLMFWFAPFATAGEVYSIDDVHLEKVNK